MLSCICYLLLAVGHGIVSAQTSTFKCHLRNAVYILLFLQANKGYFLQKFQIYLTNLCCLSIRFIYKVYTHKHFEIGFQKPSWKTLPYLFMLVLFLVHSLHLGFHRIHYWKHAIQYLLSSLTCLQSHMSINRDLTEVFKTKKDTTFPLMIPQRCLKIK